MNQAASDLREEGLSILAALWRYKVTIVVIALLGGALGYLYAQQQPPVYEASARLLLADPREAGLFGELRASSDVARHVRNQAELVTSGVIYPRASDLLDGRYAARDIEGRISVDARHDVDLLRITASAGSAEDAAAMANAVGRAYEELIVQQVSETADEAIAGLEARNAELRTEIRELSGAGTAARQAELSAALDQLTSNENRIAQLRLDATLFGTGVDVFASAEPPLAPVLPRPRRTAAVGFVLAFVLAAGTAWWRMSTSQRMEQASEPAAVLGAPLLGEVPEFSKVGVRTTIPVAEAPTTPAGEAYQFIMAALTYSLEEYDAQTVLITSCQQGEGKTLTTLNLALAAKRGGRNVIMLDADKRVKGLTKATHALDVEDHLDLVGQEAPLDWVSTIVPFPAGLSMPLVSIGLNADDPATYFRQPAFRRALERTRKRGDLLLVDTPPLLAVADTSAIAGHVDGIIMVVDRGTTLRVLQEAASRLAFIGTPVLGYIFNRSASRTATYTYQEYGGRHRKRKSAGRASSGQRVRPGSSSSVG